MQGSGQRQRVLKKKRRINVQFMKLRESTGRGSGKEEENQMTRFLYSKIRETIHLDVMQPEIWTDIREMVDVWHHRIISWTNWSRLVDLVPQFCTENPSPWCCPSEPGMCPTQTPRESLLGEENALQLEIICMEINMTIIILTRCVSLIRDRTLSPSIIGCFCCGDMGGNGELERDFLGD